MQTEVTRLLGIEYPIIQGGMAWVAEYHLAAGVSEAGGLGLIGAASAPADWVRDQVRKAKELTDKPFGVNIMLMSPYADEVAKVIVEEGVKVVTTGAGNPEKYMKMWKEAGVKVIPVVASVALAKRMERCGADALVAEGCEAGGHIGESTTMVLVPQIVAAVSIPVIAAGGMNDMDAIRLVRKRGILMQNTVPAGEGAMCAVISMAAEEIEKVIEPIADVSVANYNCPGQIVITGKTDAVEEAAAKLKEAGARRTIMLNVSGPFHSQMLVPAGEKLAEELEHTRFHELRIPYVTNVTAEKVTDIRETPGLLTTQISSPVRWMQSMERMIADGVDTFVEIGPGKTLEGFLRKIDRSVKVFHISQWEDVDKVCEKLADGGNRMEES